MVDFERIETYNTADETINFGARTLSDDDNLPEVTTLATIPISERNEGQKSSHINAVTLEGSTYFSVKTSFGVVKPMLFTRSSRVE